MTDILEDLSQFIRAEQQLDAPPPAPASAPAEQGTQAALLEAAKRYAARSDDFASGKADICRDMAAKLARFGCFASDRQADFARKLIEWSQPREQTVSAPAPTPRPNTWRAIQGFARVTIAEISFRKKHEEPLWWILWGEALVGRITAEGARGFARRMRAAGVEPATIKAALDEIERDPLAAIKAHGIATGSCGCCGRELTDPDSIALGIGPICADKLGGGF